MISCVYLDSPEGSSLVKRAAPLDGEKFKMAVLGYYNRHGRYPQLDEVYGTNSQEGLKLEFSLNNLNATSLENLFTITRTSTLEDAAAYINNIYRNLDIELEKIDDRVVFHIQERPSERNLERTEDVDTSLTDSRVFITQSLEKLLRSYGIKTNIMTLRELSASGLTENMPEISTVSAFVYDGDIYVNSDIAGIDAHTHELLHILLGSTKFTMPEIYYSLVDSVMQLPNYELLAKEFTNRAQSDINEEIFVLEYAKFLMGAENLFTQLDNEIVYLINYEIKRTLDTILMGDVTTQIIPEATLMISTLRELGTMVNSHAMENKYEPFLDSATLNRILANKKSDLMKQGILTEIC